MKEWIITGGCTTAMLLESFLYYFMSFITLINSKNDVKMTIIVFFSGMHIRDETYMRPNIPFNPDAEIPRIPRKSKRKCNENTEPKAS